jgi:hypothetical protein
MSRTGQARPVEAVKETAWREVAAIEHEWPHDDPRSVRRVFWIER